MSKVMLRCFLSKQDHPLMVRNSSTTIFIIQFLSPIKKLLVKNYITKRKIC